MPKKNITIEDLAIITKKGFDESKKDRVSIRKELDESKKDRVSIRGEIDDLAMAVKAGFDGVDEQFKRVDKQFVGVNKQLKGLEQGQERIELRLTNVAYRSVIILDGV